MIEPQLRAIVDTAVDGIVLMDSRGMVTMFSPACERMFGYSAAEIVGGDVKRLMQSPYRDEYDQYLETHRGTGGRKIVGIRREVVGLRKNGDTFPMDLAVGEADQGGVTSFVGILRDVSERKHAEIMRERLMGQLTASNLERTHFAQVASHDLREPLRMVAAFCGLLSKVYGERLDDRGREYLSLALAGTTQMGLLLDDLVDFSRLELELERGSWFSASAVLDQVLEGLGEPIREFSAEITSDVLPQIYGSRIRFHRLMQNLIGNALKYVPAGVAPRIHVSAINEGEVFRFSVADKGIGIASRHHEQIFEPFKRLHAKSAYAGTGLGLSICRKIAQGFGGDISVSSAEGQGSIFSFTVRTREGDTDHVGSDS